MGVLFAVQLHHPSERAEEADDARTAGSKGRATSRDEQEAPRGGQPRGQNPGGQMTLTEHLNAMLKAESEATKGPWGSEGMTGDCDLIYHIKSGEGLSRPLDPAMEAGAKQISLRQRSANSDLIVLARNHFAALVKCVMSMPALIEQLEA